MSGCGCNINKKSDQCTIVPEYLTGCNKCGDKHTWDTMECAYICRTNGRGQRVMDIYRSLIDDNSDHPVDGTDKPTPTWERGNTCSAFFPDGDAHIPPTVEGDNVTPVIDPVTGAITYVISPHTVDTDTWATIVDNGDGTATATNVDGTEIPLCAVCPTMVDNGNGTALFTNANGDEVVVSTLDTTVTYVFDQTNPVDGDGIIEFTVTSSDGGTPQLITLPEPTIDTDTNNDWTASALSSTGILTYTGTDGNGDPISMPPVDLNALISPALIAGTGITLDINPNTGAITVNSTVVDTTIPDTFVKYNAVQTTDANGVVTTTITVTPADGGPDVVTEIVSSVSTPHPDICVGGSVRKVMPSDTLSSYERKVCGTKKIESVSKGLATRSGIRRATVGQNIVYTFIDPISNSTVEYRADVLREWIDHISIVGGSSTAVMRLRGLGGDFDLSITPKSIGSVVTPNGCSSKVHKIEANFADIDSTVSPDTGTTCVKVIDGNITSGGGLNEAPVGTFCGDLALDNNADGFLLSTFNDGSDFSYFEVRSETTTLEVFTLNVDFYYFEPVDVYIGCDGSFIRAADSNGGSVAEGDVNYVV